MRKVILSIVAMCFLWTSSLEGQRKYTVGSITIANKLLQQRVTRLAASSESFERELDFISRSGIPVLIGLPEDVTSAVSMFKHAHGHKPSGYTATVHAEEGELVAAYVAVDLSEIERTHRRRSVGTPNLSYTIDAILIHEIYGHLGPVVRGGSVESICADPAGRSPREFQESCVGIRENQLRKELGLPKRYSYFR